LKFEIKSGATIKLKLVALF